MERKKTMKSRVFYGKNILPAPLVTERGGKLYAAPQVSMHVSCL